MAGVKPLLETIGALLPKGIKAWHASPHDFDKVDLSKIGTGQGAQSYGPGFYAAESPAVSGQGGEYWKEFLRHPNISKVEQDAADLLAKNNFDRQKAALDARKRGSSPVWGEDAEKIARLLESDAKVGPRVYELNLKADPRSFLQWDEPLKGQPAYGALQSHWDNKIGDPSIIEQRLGLSNKHAPTGEDLHHALSGASRSGEASMIQLQNAGIPGIRYADAASRHPVAAASTAYAVQTAKRRLQFAEDKGASKWEIEHFRQSVKDAEDRVAREIAATPRTYNYVVNNPDIIEIMRKLAIPGVVGGAASVYQPQGSQ